MISGHHYSVKIANHIVSVVVPDQSGDKLVEFARLALLQSFSDRHDEEDLGDYLHGLAADGRLDNIEYHGPIYVDAKVV